MGLAFRLFDVTIEIIQGKFHLGYNSKIGYTQKWSYPRVTSHFPGVKRSSVTTANIQLVFVMSLGQKKQQLTCL